MVGGTKLFEGAHLTGGGTRFFLESGRCSNYVFLTQMCPLWTMNVEDKYKCFIFGHGSHKHSLYLITHFCRDYALFGGHFLLKFGGEGHKNILYDRGMNYHGLWF